MGRVAVVLRLASADGMIIKQATGVVGQNPVVVVGAGNVSPRAGHLLEESFTVRRYRRHDGVLA